MGEYNQTILGYKYQKNSNGSRMDSAKRISILYDYAVHKMNIRQLISKHQVNYSSMRHVLALYCLFGRVEARKFKIRHSGRKRDVLENQESSC